jgi:GH35 family endo-1,4-beta-xylanase
MVKDFRSRGVLIAGVGLQMHIPLLDANLPAVAANLARLSALGLQVHITELNFRTPDLGAILRVEQENRMSQERGCGRGQWGEKLTARCHSYSFQFFPPM